jgi:hypothetical protein
MVRVTGFAAIEKSAVVLKTAVCAFSGTGAIPPFAIVMHVVVPETLLDEQPVWYLKGIPEVEPVTL